MVKLIRVPVSDDNHRILKLLAARAGMSMSEYIRRCIQHYIEVGEVDYNLDMSDGLSSWGGDRSKDD